MNNLTRFKLTEIGNIPEDWDILPIDAIKSKNRNALAIGPFGSSIKKEFFVPKGVPVIRGNNLVSYRFIDDNFVFLTEEKADQLKSANCHPGDIVITHRGTLGQVGFIPRNSKHKRYVISQSGMKLTCDESIVSSEYVFYFLKSPYGQNLLLRNTSQTGVPAIAQPISSLRNIHIPVPKLTEQKNIVKIFEQLNNRIDLIDIQNQTLEDTLREIFQSWFIDFEFPYNGKPYRSSGGQMVYKEEIKAEIPKNWLILSSISEICQKINYGYTESASEEEIGPKFLRVTDINKRDWINWANVPYCKICDNEIQKYLLEKLDIVVARMADPGKVAIFEENFPVIFASYLIRIRLNNPNLAYFLYYFMKSSYYQNFILGAATGSVQRSLNAKGLTNGLVFYQPHESLIEKFNQLVQTLRKKINKNQLFSKNLSEFRDLLLPHIISGKIRIPIIEAK
jgi:type I restriction enzyme S subunit